jgi:hypothetical protein
MGSHQALHHTTDVRSHDDFLARFTKNLLKETIFALKSIGVIFRMFMILCIGIILFLREFKFMKIVFALILPPLFIVIVGNYFTLLPTNLVIVLALVSAISLAQSEQGTSLTDWISEMIASLLEKSHEASKPASLSQKLMGFVVLSSIASLFIVFLV